VLAWRHRRRPPARAGVPAPAVDPDEALVESAAVPEPRPEAE